MNAINASEIFVWNANTGAARLIESRQPWWIISVHISRCCDYVDFSFFLLSACRPKLAACIKTSQQKEGGHRLDHHFRTLIKGWQEDIKKRCAALCWTLQRSTDRRRQQVAERREKRQNKAVKPSLCGWKVGTKRKKKNSVTSTGSN